jgi:hypothetical protein
LEIFEKKKEMVKHFPPNWRQKSDRRRIRALDE